MTIATIREKLHDYIDVADYEKVKAIYTLLGEKIETPYDWANDEEFVAELDERLRQYEDGTDPGISMEELEASIEMRKTQRSGNSLQ